MNAAQKKLVVHEVQKRLDAVIRALNEAQKKYKENKEAEIQALKFQIEHHRYALEQIAEATVYREGSCRWISVDHQQTARLALKREFKQGGESHEKSVSDRVRDAFASGAESPLRSG